MTVIGSVRRGESGEMMIGDMVVEEQRAARASGKWREILFRPTSSAGLRPLWHSPLIFPSA